MRQLKPKALEVDEAAARLIWIRTFTIVLVSICAILCTSFLVHYRLRKSTGQRLIMASRPA